MFVLRSLKRFAAFALPLLADFGVQALSSTQGKYLGQFNAYGLNVTKLPVFYCDGHALIGHHAPDWCDNAFNVSFTLTANGNVIGVPIDGSTNTTHILYVNNTASAWQSVEFASTNQTLPTDSTYTNFTIFAQVLALKTGKTLEAKWYAVQSDTEDVYGLTWNAPNDNTNDTTTVVVLKPSIY